MSGDRMEKTVCSKVFVQYGILQVLDKYICRVSPGPRPSRANNPQVNCKVDIKSAGNK